MSESFFGDVHELFAEPERLTGAAAIGEDLRRRAANAFHWLPELGRVNGIDRSD